MSSPPPTTPEEKVEVPLEDVNLTPELYERFIRSNARIRPHVALEGLKRVQSGLLNKEVDRIRSCRSVGELLHLVEEGRDRWMRMGLFNKVDYNFEAVTTTSTTGDLLVKFFIDERKAKQEFSVFTSDSGAPELRFKLWNLLGRGYSVEANFVPKSQSAHSWHFSARTPNPWLGDHFEISCGINKNLFSLRPADGERVEELKATLESHRKNSSQALVWGWNRRQLAARDPHTLPPKVSRDIGPLTQKVFLRHEYRFSRVFHHVHPLLYQMYPLPIAGTDVHLSNEISGGPFGGDVSKLTQELSFTRHVPLHPLLSFSLQGRLGCVWNLGHDSFLNDRLFLGWRNIRGFESVGPSTLSPEWREGANPWDVIRYAAVGGNALWALSSSLNFPLPFIPTNGVLACHLFANVGNNCWIPTLKDLQNRWKELFHGPAASVGAGLVLTQVPILGNIFPSGRLEFNVQVPVQWRDGSLDFNASNPSLFRRFRFGLIWTSDGGNLS